MYLDIIKCGATSILLVVSFLGYGLFLQERKVNSSVIPFVIFCSIVCIMYFGGLAGFLKQTALLLLVAGLALFAFFVLKFIKDKAKIPIMPFLTLGFCFLLVFACFYAVRMRHVYLVQYDNFSHWGMYVKEIFRFDSFPRGNSMIEPQFKNYPPGAALFIYYICSFIGRSEGRALFAQALLVGSAFAAPMAFASLKKISHYVISIATFFVISTIIISCMFNLLVDTLIAVMFVGLLAVITLYSNDLKLMIILSAPILSSLILVKDIGNIFAVIGVLYALLHIVRSVVLNKKGLNKTIISAFTLCFIVLPAIITLTWMNFYHRAFTNTHGEKFSVGMLLHPSRSEGFYRILLTRFLKKLEDINRYDFKPVVIITLISLMVLAISASIIKLEALAAIKEQNICIKPYYILYGLISSCIVYIMYMSFLLSFYLFIMPENEARNLAAFGRYEAAVSIVVIGIQSMSLLLATAEGKSFRHKQLAALTACLFLLYAPQVKKDIGSVVNPPDQSARLIINKSIKGVRLSKNKGLLVYIPLNDKGYYYYMIRYLMGSNNIKIINSIPYNKKTWDRFLNKNGSYILLLSKYSSLTDNLKKNHFKYIKVKNKSNLYRVR